MNETLSKVLQIPNKIELEPELRDYFLELLQWFWWSIPAMAGAFSIVTISLTIFTLVQYHNAYWKSRWVHELSDEPYVLPYSAQRKVKEDAVWKKIFPNVKIYCDQYIGVPMVPNFAIRRMNNLMKKVFDLKIEEKDTHSTKLVKENPIPNDACTISIAMDGFVHGRECHDFTPTRRRIRGSHFAFRIYGDDRIQVIYYVEDGVCYVAGVCIYIRYPQDWGVHYRMKFIEECLKSTSYPARNQLKTEGFHTRELTVEYCRVLRRNMLTAFKPEGAFHQEWNHNEDVMTIEKCHRCTNRANRDRPPTYFSLTVDAESGQQILSRSL